MKGLLICRASHHSALQETFPERHLWLLPVAGKPIIEYQLETLARLGIQEIRLLCDSGSQALEARYGNGERLGLQLSYGPLPASDELATVLQRNQGFCLDQDLVVFQGLAITAPLHQPHCLRLTEPVRLNAGEDQTTLLLALPAERQLVSLQASADYTALPWVESRRIDSLNAYYQENIGLMQRWQNRISWPAYGSEAGFQLGERISLSSGLSLTGNGLIGGCSVLAENISLEDSILGREVMIGKGCRLRRSVVLDGSWIGPGLNLDEKIVDGQTLIDPHSGSRLELAESGWLDRLERAPLASFAERLLAAVLWLGLLPAYSLWTAREQQRVQLKHGELDLPQAGTGFAARLQLHLVPRWRAVLRGELALVGQEPVATHAPNHYRQYLPAALAFSRWRGSSGEQARLDDASYPLFARPAQNIRICLRYLWRCLSRDAQRTSGVAVPEHG